MELDRDSMEKTLAALEAERAELDTTIEFLKRKLGRSDSENGSSSSTTASKHVASGQIHHDTFYGMSVIDAAKKYLSIVGKPARSTQEVMDGLKKGGIDKEYATVSSVLARAARTGQGLDNVGRGNWGLSEWYPGTARKSGKSNDKESHPDEKESPDKE